MTKEEFENIPSPEEALIKHDIPEDYADALTKEMMELWCKLLQEDLKEMPATACGFKVNYTDLPDYLKERLTEFAPDKDVVFTFKDKEE